MQLNSERGDCVNYSGVKKECFFVFFAEHEGLAWLLPQVNFVGKLLGPQGSTIKRLQEDTGAKISVLGKGSMRDKNKVCVTLCYFCDLYLYANH